MIKPNSTLISNMHTQDLIQYLELSNWQDAAPFNTKWFVFRGPNDADGEPLEIVIPRDDTARDLPVYLASAVNLLSALVEENPIVTVRRIMLETTIITPIEDFRSVVKDDTGA